MVRILICGASAEETLRLCRRSEAHFAAGGIPAEIVSAFPEERFRAEFAAGGYTGAVIGLENARGFLCARWASAADENCRVALICDTDRYAIPGHHIHLTDFLIRPCGEQRFGSMLDRLAGAP